MAERKYSRKEAEDTSVVDTSSKSVERIELVLNKLIKNLRASLKELSSDSTKAAEDLYSDINDLEDQLYNKKLDLFKQGSKAQETAIKIQHAYEDKLFLASNAQERIQLRKMQIQRLEDFKKQYKTQQQLALKLEAEKEVWEAAAADREKELNEELDDLKKQQIQERHEQELANLEKQIEKNREYLDTHKKAFDDIKKDIELKVEAVASLANESNDPALWKQAAEMLKEAAKDSTLAEDERKELLKESKKLDTKLKAEARKEQHQDQIQAAKDRNADRIAELKYRLTTLDGIKETIGNATAALVNGLSKMFDNMDSNINTFYEYQAKYQARLEGSENDYKKMMSNINKQIGLSPFVKQTEMVKNIQKLIDSGINYNVELRAYLATVSEGIASTFDAFDSNLLRLIRIQQSDSTAARLGMENILNEMLNKMYSDSSYLGTDSGSGLADQVSAALLDASAQLTHQGAMEMEFVAQKWLGSLYSLGVSDSAIQAIAQALGQVGSGNIESLASNESLMSLIAMSSSYGGTSISDILTNGLTADRTNKLLQGMVTYLAEIANNTDSSNVTQAAVAQVFGLTATDLRSITNLTQSDIKTIYDTNLNYSQALTEASKELTQISSRTHLSQVIANVIENANTGAALTLGSNGGLYAMYKALNIVSSLVGDRGLEIPGIQALGTGTASGIDVLSVAKAGIAGGSLLASLIGAIGNVGSGGLPSLSSWKGYEQSLQRGQGIDLSKAGVQSGFSENVTYSSKGNASTSDISAAAMQSSNEMAVENQSEDDRKTADAAAKFYEDGLPHLEAIHAGIYAVKETADSIKSHITGLSNYAINSEIFANYLDSIDNALTRTNPITNKKVTIYEYIEALDQISTAVGAQKAVTPSYIAYEQSVETDRELLTTVTQLQHDVAQTSQALKVDIINDTPLNVTVAESTLPTKVEISNLSDSLSTKMNQALRAIIMSAFADELINPKTGETTLPLAEQLKNALSGLNVHVDNDFFDEFLQKSAFGGF